MGIDDKANLTVIHHIGAAKEGTREVAGNEELPREGRSEQTHGPRQETGEQVNAPVVKD